MPRIHSLLADFEHYGLKPDSHTFFQLLLACKKTRNPQQAYAWFDQLLSLGVEPIELLCGVLRDTVGVQR